MNNDKNDKTDDNIDDNINDDIVIRDIIDYDIDESIDFDSNRKLVENIDKSLLYIACEERNIDVIKFILNSCNKITTIYVANNKAFFRLFVFLVHNILHNPIRLVIRGSDQ